VVPRWWDIAQSVMAGLDPAIHVFAWETHGSRCPELLHKQTFPADHLLPGCANNGHSEWQPTQIV
jgi:hypothetical protein